MVYVCVCLVLQCNLYFQSHYCQATLLPSLPTITIITTTITTITIITTTITTTTTT